MYLMQQINSHTPSAINSTITKDLTSDEPSGKMEEHGNTSQIEPESDDEEDHGSDPQEYCEENRVP